MMTTTRPSPYRSVRLHLALSLPMMALLVGCASGSTPTEPHSGGGAGGEGGQGGATTTGGGAGGEGGQGGATTTGGGAGGEGGGAGGEGGGSLCAPGSTAPCYSGPAGTEGVGVCVAGLATCDASGSSYGPCVGETVPTADLCATAEDEDCNAATTSCVTPPLFAALYGDAANSAGAAVAVDAAGDRFVTGWFSGTIDFGNGPLVSASGRDAFVAKLDGAGNAIWSKRFGNSNSENARAIAVDPEGNVVVTGHMWGTVDFGGGLVGDTTVPAQQSMFLVKLDGDGNHLFSKAFHSTADTFRGLAIGPTGEIVIGDQFTGTVNLGGADLTSDGRDFFVASFDPFGNHSWSRRFGGPQSQELLGVAVDGAGSIVLTGGFEATVDFGGGPVTAISGYDAFLTKLDAHGNLVWSRRFGGAGDEATTGVAVDPAGDIVFSAFSTFGADFGGGPVPVTPATEACHVVKVSPSGEHVWSRGHGCAVEEGWFSAVALDAAGNTWVTGSFDGSTSFGGATFTSATNDIFVFELDPSGAHVWSQAFGGTSFDMGLGVASAGASVLVTGIVGSSVDFGGGLLVSRGGKDMFLLELQP